MHNTPFEHFLSSAPVSRGLPAAAYTGAEFHDAENARLFPRAWVFAGFAHELARRGDVWPVDVGGRPVVLVRGEGGGVKAFHNVCRHRCLQLVERAGNVGKMIRCPYHQWAYDLEGALRATPFFGGMDANAPEGFERGENGLVEVRCEVWHDWIFVNLDGGAVGFDEFIRPLAERLAHLDLSRLAPVATLDFGEVKCNWKFLMENFIEPYHVQFVHSTTTEQPLADHRAFADRHCLGSEVELPERAGVDAKAETDVPSTLAVDSNYLTLFPNFVLATYAPDQLGAHLNTPVGAGRTRQRRVIYLLRDAESSAPAREVDALKELWWKVHKEDHEMCERLQLGRRSAVADGGGWLSPVWESSVRRFQELVYDAVAGKS